MIYARTSNIEPQKEFLEHFSVMFFNFPQNHFRSKLFSKNWQSYNVMPVHSFSGSSKRVITQIPFRFSDTELQILFFTELHVTSTHAETNVSNACTAEFCKITDKHSMALRCHKNSQ
jgi:hypothetical protein